MMMHYELPTYDSDVECSANWLPSKYESKQPLEHSRSAAANYCNTIILELQARLDSSVDNLGESITEIVDPPRQPCILVMRLCVSQPVSVSSPYRFKYLNTQITTRGHELASTAETKASDKPPMWTRRVTLRSRICTTIYPCINRRRTPLRFYQLCSREESVYCSHKILAG